MCSLLITPGEPAGIGPELAIKAVSALPEQRLTIIADPQLIEQRAALLGIAVSLNILNLDQRPRPGSLNVLPVALSEPSVAGELQSANAQYVIETLTIANMLCMANTYDAVITGPVQKSVINDAGIPFSGHTEFFAEHSGTQKVVMMLATEGLRVALATTHLPLKDVPSAITQTSLAEILKILIADLKHKFNIEKPRILVAGLNPHAGEGGHLGREEIDTIIPTLAAFQGQQVDLVGPLPADTLFTPHNLSRCDAVLAMYHDQGLPVLKHKGFGNAVNITLGLPYIRTSVDHGTALDLAGTGKADVSSLLEAIRVAAMMAQGRH